MKRRAIVVVAIAAMASGLLRTQAAEPAAPAEGLISITLDSVNMVNVVRMFSRIAAVDFVYVPQDLGATKRVSLNLANKPWRPALEAILAAQGLVLLPQGAGIYSIAKADKPEVAVRVQSASAAVALAEAALADMKGNDIAGATARLQAFAQSNRDAVKAFEASHSKPPAGSAKKAATGTEAAPQPQR